MSLPRTTNYKSINTDVEACNKHIISIQPNIQILRFIIIILIFIAIIPLMIVSFQYNTMVSNSDFCCPINEMPYFLKQNESSLDKYNLIPNIVNKENHTIYYCTQNEISSKYGNNNVNLEDLKLGMIMLKITMFLNIIIIIVISLIYLYCKVKKFILNIINYIYIIIFLILTSISLNKIIDKFHYDCLNNKEFNNNIYSSLNLIYNYEFAVFTYNILIMLLIFILIAINIHNIIQQN